MGNVLLPGGGEQTGSLGVAHAPPFPSVGCLYLVGVRVEIKVLEEAGCKFAEEEIVGLIDCPHAPVRVVVGAGAGAEGPHCRGTEGSP